MSAGQSTPPCCWPGANYEANQPHLSHLYLTFVGRPPSRPPYINKEEIDSMHLDRDAHHATCVIRTEFYCISSPPCMPLVISCHFTVQCASLYLAYLGAAVISLHRDGDVTPGLYERGSAERF